MMFLTLAEIKAQIRITHDYEDTLLTTYGEAAESKILSDTGYTYAELLTMSTDRTGTAAIDPKLRLAGLMLVAGWYKHREPEENLQMYSVPYAYENLISDYVRHNYRKESEEDEDDDE